MVVCCVVLVVACAVLFLLYVCVCDLFSKGFVLTWYRALTWYSSPARPFAAPDDPLLVTGQQGSPSPACQQLSRARYVCGGGLKQREYQVKARYQVRANACYVCVRDLFTFLQNTR